MKNSLLCFRIPPEDVERIPDVLKGGETQSAFARAALIREIERREAIIAKRPMAIERFED